MQDELALIDGAVQLIEHAEAPSHRAGQGRFPDLGAVRAAYLGFLQRHIQIAQHVIFGAVSRTGDQITDVPGQTDTLIASKDRGGDHLQQPAGECLDIGRTGT